MNILQIILVYLIGIAEGLFLAKQIPKILEGYKEWIRIQNIPEYHCDDCGTREYRHTGPGFILCHECYLKRNSAK